jgi:hypothetical protein
MRVEHVAFDKPIRRACGHLERYQCRVMDRYKQERAIADFQAQHCGACRLGVTLVKRTRLMPSVEEAQCVMQTPIGDLRLFALGVKVLLATGRAFNFGVLDGIQELTKLLK